MEDFRAIAEEVIRRCQSLAKCTEEPGFTTRTFLSEPMRQVHSELGGWMQNAGMAVSVDAAGNLRGCYAADKVTAPRLFIGSHLDTVRRAGSYDGILGVVAGVALVDLLQKRRLHFHIEVIGFSEEEGLRFGVPFIGSRALAGTIDEALLDRVDAHGVSVRTAIDKFGLDSSRIADARAPEDAFAYLEFHIEQGPVLDTGGLPLGLVEAIAGQSRLTVSFKGQTNHAGTTPMNLRRDALAGAAEWIGAVEKEGRSTEGLVATVGRIHVEPGVSNIVSGLVEASLDVRHADDSVRRAAVQHILASAQKIGEARHLIVAWEYHLDQSAVPMDASLSGILEHAASKAGYTPRRMISGAGHDAMIVAARMPTAMLFIRSPGGISHDAVETVYVDDVAAALSTGLNFLEEVEARHG